MSYSVKEVFHTLQGEGMNAGRAAVFLRFAGCNLWSGRALDRGRGAGGCSAWCDTDFVGTDGDGGGSFADAESLAQHVEHTWRGGPVERLVVCTGGEPLLQLDAPLIAALRGRGFRVAVETNGTRPVPAGIDWLCVSPKAGTKLVVETGNELKLVFPQAGLQPSQFEHLAFEHWLLQPLDGPAARENTRLAVEFCLENPRWRLSLQTHKTLGIR